MQHTATKKTRLIDLLRASGEGDLGALPGGLLRMAHLAAAMHRAEVAAKLSGAAQGGEHAQEVGRANGLARSSAVVAALATGRGSDHTEVVR